MVRQEREEFNYYVKKYLYELKTHKPLRKYYDKAVVLVSKFENQQPPLGASFEELKAWERIKLTYAKVLSVLRRYISYQSKAPRKEIALVRTKYGYKLKAYAPRLLDEVEHRYTSFVDLITEQNNLPSLEKKTGKNEHQYRQAMREVAKKQRDYKWQSQTILEIERNSELDEYISQLTFINKDLERCFFTPLQQHDMGLIFQKRYSLLNWQQGSGKTAVVYHYGRYVMDQGLVRNVVILAPALATYLTWEDFLKRQREPYMIARSWRELQDVPPDTFVLVSLSMMGTLHRSIKKSMKRLANKICLIFDESDEITNPDAQLTERSLDIFRRARCKILSTGTTTRNSINELYSQFELLYNNSVNMLCQCPRVYKLNKEKEIESEVNDRVGQPFPARGGANLFKSCFCPTKSTVFGLEKVQQDIYNQTYLSELIRKTVLTRKFREFAGDKYEVQTHDVIMSVNERYVYKIIMKDFVKICHRYFASTGDARKEAQLRLIRQIKLMIRACSTPHKMSGYFGEPYPRKVRKISRIVRNITGKVAIGCTTLEAVDMYAKVLSELFTDRQVFIIKGDVGFKRRQNIIEQFEATGNGILICTQQSLRSSANIPSCNDVILESLQWNIPKMEQFYFRFVRLDSKEFTNVHLVTYVNSIEQNLLALVLTKERLNDFIKTGEVKDQSAIFDEFDISPNLIESLLTRERDEDGNFYIRWGEQRVA